MELIASHLLGVNDSFIFSGKIKSWPVNPWEKHYCHFLTAISCNSPSWEKPPKDASAKTSVFVQILCRPW